VCRRGSTLEASGGRHLRAKYRLSAIADEPAALQTKSSVADAGRGLTRGVHVWLVAALIELVNADVAARRQLPDYELEPAGTLPASRSWRIAAARPRGVNGFGRKATLPLGGA